MGVHQAVEADERPGRPRGLVGPNAITRMAQALEAIEGPERCRAVFLRAGLAQALRTPPTDMVNEEDVAALQAATFATLGTVRARAVCLEAGRLTGDYLLANRIPHAAQRLLRWLPRSLAARILVRAIARHAWTFAGSGRFSYRFSGGLKLSVEHSPLCRRIRCEQHACHYFAGTFARVFEGVLGPGVQVCETACEAVGDPACVFHVSW